MGAIDSCSGKTLKYLVFFFNFLVFVAGIAILAGSIVAYVWDPLKEYFLKNDKLKEVLKGDADSLNGVLIVGMVLGSILLVMGFLGCCGAVAENQCLLATFVAIMILLLITQITIGILVLVFKDKLRDKYDEAFDVAIKNKIDCEKFWKPIQDGFKCCGKGGKPETYCGKQAVCPTDGVGKGCADVSYDYFKGKAKMIGIVLLVFMVLEIAAVLFGLMLCCAIKNKSSYE